MRKQLILNHRWQVFVKVKDTVTTNYEILEKMAASSEFEARCDLKYVHPDIREASKLEQDLRLIQEEVAYIEANPV